MNWIALAIAALALVKLLEVVHGYLSFRVTQKLAEEMAASAGRSLRLNEQHLANHGVKLKPELEVADVVDISAKPREQEEPEGS